jgi:hypothetical protein
MRCRHSSVTPLFLRGFFIEVKIFIVVKVPCGDSHLETLADLVAVVVHQAGHEPFVNTYEIARSGLSDPKDFMPIVRQQAESSALMIVLYHPELRGGLIEMGITYAHGIPV